MKYDLAKLMKENLLKIKKYSRRLEEGAREVDPPVEIAKKLDLIFSSVYDATSGVLATQMLKMNDLSDLIRIGDWFYYKPSDLYYYLADHRTKKLFIVESKNSPLQLNNGTNSRAEPTWFKNLNLSHKKYFLPILKEYEFDDYKVTVMPLVEKVSLFQSNDLDEKIYQDIPEEFIDSLYDLDIYWPGKPIEFGKYNDKFVITNYEGSKSQLEDYKRMF